MRQPLKLQTQALRLQVSKKHYAFRQRAAYFVRDVQLAVWTHLPQLDAVNRHLQSVVSHFKRLRQQVCGSVLETDQACSCSVESELFLSVLCLCWG